MIEKTITAARGHGFNPPQVLALIAYLETNPTGCDSPPRAIVSRLVENGADAVNWDCDQNWPWMHAKRKQSDGRRRTPASEALRSGSDATDYDAMFDAIAAAKHPADPEANAKNASVREEWEQSAVESLEQRLGAELDQIPDVDLPTLCTASKDRSIDEAARDARSKLAPYGRDDPRTRAALLKLLDVRQRREPAIVS